MGADIRQKQFREQPADAQKALLFLAACVLLAASWLWANLEANQLFENGRVLSCAVFLTTYICLLVAVTAWQSISRRRVTPPWGTKGSAAGWLMAIFVMSAAVALAYYLVREASSLAEVLVLT